MATWFFAKVDIEANHFLIDSEKEHVQARRQILRTAIALTLLKTQHGKPSGREGMLPICAKLETGKKLGREEPMWMTEVVGNHSSESSHQLSNRLMIKSRGRVIFVPAEEIDWIEAQANYLLMHLSGNVAHLSRQTMGQMTQQLDSSSFLRIHRSFIVNVSRIREVQPTGRGDFIVVLRDGKQLPCSRSYRHALQALYSQARRGEVT